MTGRLEKTLVVDENRNTMLVDLFVLRTLELQIDCGCWNHAARHFEIIVTDRFGSFVRALGTDHAFRPIDMNGPITLSVEKDYKP